MDSRRCFASGVRTKFGHVIPTIIACVRAATAVVGTKSALKTAQTLEHVIVRSVFPRSMEAHRAVRHRAVADIKAVFESRIRPFEPWLWALFVGICRGPLFPLTEQDVDGANFARAVEKFDLVEWAPHPPGYPVFIAAAKCIRAVFLDDPSRALAAVSLLSSVLLVAAVFSVFVRVFDRPTARLTSVLFLASPLLTLFSVRPLSDGLGTALAWAVLSLSLRARAESSDTVAAGVLALAALLPGVRASVLPFVLPPVLYALWTSRRKWLVFGAGFGTLLAYIVPYLIFVDVLFLFRRTISHAHGHFTDYGGSVFSNFDAVHRFVGLVRAFWAHALAGAWEGRPATTLFTAAALFVLIPFVRINSLGRHEAGRLLFWSGGLYFLWIVLGQNIVEQPRHVLPLVPALLGILACTARNVFYQMGVSWWNHLRKVILVAGVVAAFWESTRLGLLQARYPAHIVRIARYVSNEPDAATLTVATWRFYRWIGWRAPNVRVMSVGNIDEARALVKSARGRVLVTSEVPGAEQLDVSQTVLRVSADPFVRYVYEDVRVMEMPAVPYNR